MLQTGKTPHRNIFSTRRVLTSSHTGTLITPWQQHEVYCLGKEMASNSRHMSRCHKGSILCTANRSMSFANNTNCAGLSLINVLHPIMIPKYTELVNLKARLLSFSRTTKLLQLSDQDIAVYQNQKISITAASMRLLRISLKLLVELPLFLPGIIIHSPVYILGKAAESVEKFTESVAQDKIALALGLLVPLYSTLFYLIWRWMDYSLGGFLLSAFLIPTFVRYHMALLDKRYDLAKDLVAAWRMFVALTGGKSQRAEVEEAVELRKWCAAQLKTVLLKLKDDGNQDASYLVEQASLFFEDGVAPVMD